MDIKLAKIKQKVEKAGKLGRNDMEELLKNAMKAGVNDDDSFDRPDSGCGDEEEDELSDQEEEELLQELQDED